LSMRYQPRAWHRVSIAAQCQDHVERAVEKSDFSLLV
jgi:hypothetical protein